MRNIKIMWILFSLITISCSKSEKKEIITNEKIRRYSIIYTNNSYANLIVFDYNDTIYLSKKIEHNINKYVKIKSDEETLKGIREAIINHLDYKSLLVERNFILHSGYLDVSVMYGENKIQMIQTEVDTDLRVSKGFFNLINDLKEKYKEVEDLF
ncbi:hypothetical protein [Flavobacterium sp. SM2513]|uniref:hypothetical protein n=1 Tax=Flavobacterium sp. SM2513 TaxID=3424766 RepID=UPI003D7FD242